MTDAGTSLDSLGFISDPGSATPMNKVPMRAPVKSFLAVGTAFAAGIAVTAAFVGGAPERPQVQQGMAGGPPLTAQAPKAAGPVPDARQPETAAKGAAASWVDPVRQRAAASGANPPLVFHMDRKREQAKVGPVRDGQGADDGFTRQAAIAVPPPRRPAASELLAQSEAHRESVAANESADATPASRAPGFAPSPKPRQTASIQRRTAGDRLAVSDADQDDARPTAVRPSRRVSMARRDDADGPGYYPPRHVEALDRYERDFVDRAPAPRRRVTAAETGGVLRWLDQP